MDYEQINDIQSTSNITFVNATEDYYKDQLAKKDERIQQLEQHVQRVETRDIRNATEIGNIRNAMQEWTKEALESREISETNAEEIADIVGFDLSTEVEVEVTVTYSMSVKVPYGEDVEDIINNVDFDSINYDTDKIDYVSVDISDISY